MNTYYEILTNNLELDTNYLNGSIQIVSNERNSVIVQSKPIYEGSSIQTQDLILYLEFFKCSMKLGDNNIAMILGMLASTLPAPNEISEALKNSSRTVYHYLQYLQSNFVNSARASVHECMVCSKGCIAYVGSNLDLTACPVCGTNKSESEKVC